MNFETQEKAQVIRAKAEIPVKDETMRIEMEYVSTVEIQPAVSRSRVGDGNKGLRIISITKDNSTMMIKVEGLEGRNYVLGITEAEKIDRVEGGSLEKGSIVIAIPDRNSGQFASHTVMLYLR